MDEAWARALVVLGAVGIATLIAYLSRRRAREAPREVGDAGLAPGLYLFTTANCPDCELARRKLDAALGQSGYVELRWQASPEVFSRLAVSEVPATLVVTAGGAARMWTGQPEKAVAAFGP